MAEPVDVNKMIDERLEQVKKGEMTPEECKIRIDDLLRYAGEGASAKHATEDIAELRIKSAANKARVAAS